MSVRRVARDNTKGRITIGGTTTTLRPGDAVQYVEVVRFTKGECVVFSYGAENFTLCEGKSRAL